MSSWTPPSPALMQVVAAHDVGLRPASPDLVEAYTGVTMPSPTPAVGDAISD
jgi:hypothetical protein